MIFLHSSKLTLQHIKIYKKKLYLSGFILHEHAKTQLESSFCHRTFLNYAGLTFIYV
jgi:hypothetical protein